MAKTPSAGSSSGQSSAVMDVKGKDPLLAAKLPYAAVGVQPPSSIQQLEKRGLFGMFRPKSADDSKTSPQSGQTSAPLVSKFKSEKVGGTGLLKLKNQVRLIVGSVGKQSPEMTFRLVNGKVVSVNQTPAQRKKHYKDMLRFIKVELKGGPAASSVGKDPLAQNPRVASMNPSGSSFASSQASIGTPRMASMISPNGAAMGTPREPASAAATSMSADPMSQLEL